MGEEIVSRDEIIKNEIEKLSLLIDIEADNNGVENVSLKKAIDNSILILKSLGVIDISDLLNRRK